MLTRTTERESRDFRIQMAGDMGVGYQRRAVGDCPGLSRIEYTVRQPDVIEKTERISECRFPGETIVRNYVLRRMSMS
ncbi:MAG: hypothetical protein QM766_04620 [Burkholderiaceae bacterium]